MKVSVIAIGDELLLGQVTDTNSGAIARMIRPLGWEMAQVRVIPDNPDKILETISECLPDSEIVITTGGLGPTKDDLTKETMRQYFGGEMVMNDEVTANIRRVFELRGLKMNALTEGQAMVPSSCEVIQNRFGTAPIMWFEKEGHVLVAMPGVPFETEGMLPEVMERLKKRFTPDEYRRHATLIVTDITESALATRLETFEEGLTSNLHLAYLPTPGLIRLRLDGCDTDKDRLDKDFDIQYALLRRHLGSLLLHEGDATPAQIVIELAREKGVKIATAESCTGGTIASRITAIAGASDVFNGGVVSYSNELKHAALKVSVADIAAHGAVSEPVVSAMAEGAARLCEADYAVATSGIAGPGGGSAEKPVGTVWMALHTPQGTSAWVQRFPGDRARVIDRAATTVLIALAKELKDC